MTARHGAQSRRGTARARHFACIGGTEQGTARRAGAARERGTARCAVAIWEPSAARRGAPDEWTPPSGAALALIFQVKRLKMRAPSARPARRAHCPLALAANVRSKKVPQCRHAMHLSTRLRSNCLSSPRADSPDQSSAVTSDTSTAPALRSSARKAAVVSGGSRALLARSGPALARLGRSSRREQNARRRFPRGADRARERNCSSQSAPPQAPSGRSASGRRDPTRTAACPRRARDLPAAAHARPRRGPTRLRSRARQRAP